MPFVIMSDILDFNAYVFCYYILLAYNPCKTQKKLYINTKCVYDQNIYSKLFYGKYVIKKRVRETRESLARRTL